MDYVLVAVDGEIPLGGRKCCMVHGRPIVLIHVADQLCGIPTHPSQKAGPTEAILPFPALGRYRALDAFCFHGGGPLGTHGDIEELDGQMLLRLFALYMRERARACVSCDQLPLFAPQLARFCPSYVR